MSAYFETVDAIIEAYGGSVDKHIGDNVMAVFGAPVAHANDPERALRAALNIHHSLAGLSEEFGRQLQAHIGIASGRVVASGTGSDAYREYTVTGSSVNLASRLQGQAAAGETLISQAVHRAVPDWAETEPVGKIEVKGFAEAIPAWKLKDLRREPAASRRGPLIGRRVECRQFAALIEECLETGGGRAVLVRGEAGIGKTRLIEEFVSLAQMQGFACHSGLVLDFGVGRDQDAIRGIVRSLLGLTEGASETGHLAAVDYTIGSGLLAEDARVFLNDLVDLPQPSELRTLYDAMDHATRNAGKERTVSQLLKGLSAQQPILLTVEDIHWADMPTLGHLKSIASGVAGCPALLVMSSRVEGDPLDPAWRASLRGNPLTTVELQPLRPAEAEELANSFARSHSAFIRDCIARAEGNPLFLEQLLRNAEEGFLSEVPDSIQSLVLARMDRLAPEDKQALQAAAAIGQRFGMDTLRTLLGDPGYDCSALVEHYLVRPEGEGYLFAHALIQECVYSSMLQGQRRTLHRRAADWFAERDVVLHAEHLDRAEDARAPRAYLDAARQQAGAYHYERAGGLAGRGLELAKDTADRWALNCLHGELLHDAGQIQASTKAYENALQLAENEEQRIQSWIGLAADMRMLDHYEAALEMLDKAESAAKAAGLTRELSRIHHLRGNIFFPLGRIEECRAQHELARDEARRARALDCEAQALGGLGDAAYAQGRMASAREHFARCAELSQAHGLGRSAVANSAMVGDADFFLCEFRRGIEGAEAAARAAERIGHYRAQAIAHRSVALCALEVADLERAREHWERSQAILEARGMRRFEPVQLVYRATLAAHEGDQPEARVALEKALEICKETGESFLGPWVIGRLAMVTEDPDKRRELLLDGERILQGGSVSHNHLWFYRCAVEASLKSQDWDEARRYASELEDYTRAEPLPWSGFFVRWGRALAAWGRGQRNPELVAELQDIREEAERVRLIPALPMLIGALEAA